MENIKVKKSILFQISYFRKSEVKKLRVFTSFRDCIWEAPVTNLHQVDKKLLSIYHSIYDLPTISLTDVCHQGGH